MSKSTLTIIQPNGTELLTTDNPIALAYARVQIKHLHLIGFRVRTSSGIICPIGINGRITHWPIGKQISVDEIRLLAELLH